jgi:RNA polymerase sigma-70 factor
LSQPFDIASIIERGQRKWPAVAPPQGLEAFVRRCLPDDQPVHRWLAEAPVEDLFLACACVEGSTSALNLFEREFVARVGQQIGRLRPSADFVDEVKQRLRERLFVGIAGGRPKIWDYSAKGSLAAWVRVLALRIALDLKRSRNEPLPEPAHAPGPDKSVGDVEAQLVRQRYGYALQRALERAMGGLSPDQRKMLRLHFVEGMTFEELGAMFGVHKVTIWRQIAAARIAVVDATRRIMLDEGAIEPGEFESIIRTVHSQLNISLSQS